MYLLLRTRPGWRSNSKHNDDQYAASRQLKIHGPNMDRNQPV